MINRYVKPYRVFLLAIATVLMFLVAACGEEVTTTKSPTGSVMFDDFEDGDISDWTESIPGDNTISFDAGANGTANSISLSGGSIVHPDGLEKALTITTPTSISLYVKNVSTGLSGGYVMIGNGTVPGTNDAIFFYMANSGLMGPLFYVTVPFAANTWYFVEFRNIDYTNFTFDFYVDGTLVHTGVPFRINLTSLDRISIYNYQSSQSWFDEISLTP